MVPPASAPVAAPTSADLLTAAARAVSNGSSLETVSRPFLDLLHVLTGLDSMYLSEVDAGHDRYLIRYADNRDGLEVPEGAEFPWSETLCKQAYETGRRSSVDPVADYPKSDLAVDYGVVSFVSVPVVTAEDHLMGTLCGISGRSVPIRPETVDVMSMLARLIADQWEQDRRHDEAIRRAEQAERRLRERATFLAEAEHKLKTPLTIVQGWSELLREDWPEMPDDERREAFEIMARAARTANRQLQQLLDEARGEVLALHLTPTAVPLCGLVTEVGRQLIGAAGADHRVSVTPGPPVLVRADREALWQSLWHLTENALKYSPEGGPIELAVTLPGDGTAQISVVDEGVGIPDGVDLFAPFVRGGPDLIGAIPGTGLGLHIVRNLVHAMGGEVAAYARERGAEFRITLPLTEDVA